VGVSQPLRGGFFGVRMVKHKWTMVDIEAEYQAVLWQNLLSIC